MLKKVYRSGIVKAPRTRGIEARSFLQADKMRPIGRQGRETAIFASPDLKGVAPWFDFNAEMQNRDPFVRELIVESDAVYVYSVTAWDESCWGANSYEPYWNSGITLTEYQMTDGQQSRDSSKWELLLRANDVLTVRDVPDEEFLEACRNSYEHHSALASNLQSSRNSLVWA